MQFDVLADRVEATRHLRGGDGIGGACAVNCVGSLPWAHYLLLHALVVPVDPSVVGLPGGRIEAPHGWWEEVTLAAVNRRTLVWIRTW